MREKTETKSGPLAGLIVVDLTRVLAGPYAALLLAELGARIIKVEPPGKGDDSRHIGPFVKTKSGGTKSGYFMSVNRGKESIALDLKADADREIFYALLSKADVLIENYRGGTMEKLGLGYDALKQKFPQLIYAAVSGFGHTGPYAKRPAYDMVVQAMGGIMSLTGHPGTPPTRVGSSVGDLTAGLFTTIGIVTALYDRKNTGAGQKVDVAMLDSQVAIWKTQSRVISRPAMCPVRWARAIPPSRPSPLTPPKTGTSLSPLAMMACSQRWLRCWATQNGRAIRALPPTRRGWNIGKCCMRKWKMRCANARQRNGWPNWKPPGFPADP